MLGKQGPSAEERHTTEGSTARSEDFELMKGSGHLKGFHVAQQLACKPVVICSPLLRVEVRASCHGHVAR